MEAVAFAEEELSLSRVIDAPSDQVFAAWTDPGLLQEWFASRPGITSMVLTFEEKGGKTRYTARVLHRASAEISADSLHDVAAVFGL
jgi:Polyketide cyclase / dehydrase and lipid transport